MPSLYRDKETELVAQRRFSKKLPQDIQQVAHRKMQLVKAAEALEDLARPPGNRLEALSGNRAGQHSIRINDQWRICFEWIEGGARNIEITDYH